MGRRNRERRERIKARLEEPIGRGASPADNRERLRDSLCCSGAHPHTIREGGSQINLIILNKLAEWPHLTAMNVDVPESRDNPLAMATVCDRCLKQGIKTKYAMAGRTGGKAGILYERVPIELLQDAPEGARLVEEEDGS